MDREPGSPPVSEWIDLTRPMDETLITWPGRSRPNCRWEKRLADGHHCNVSFWELSAHSGTHMDAPLHFMAGGKSIDQIPADVFIGECVVAEAASADRHAGAKRLLLKTDDAEKPYEALLSEQTATRLIKGGLMLIGTERLSVDDSGGRDFRMHNLFLGAGCVIIEGLHLANVPASRYLLHAAPLRMAGMEASPLRALLRRAP